MNSLRSLLAVAVIAISSACGPEFPAFWLIEPDPLAASGEIDPAGKLRVLAVRAEPPEAALGQTVSLQSLVAIHPQQGRLEMQDGMPVRTPQPQSLSALWFVCRELESQVSPQPCELGPAGTWFDSQPLPSTMASDGPTSEMVVSAAAASETLPASRIVTMIVADGTLPGGAQACLASAKANQGVVPDANHCLIAVKRVRISTAAQKNSNPAIAKLWFGGPDVFVPFSGGVLEYPLLDPATSDEDRPQQTFGVERAADSIEVVENDDGTTQTETVSATVFVTGGTLEAGRGSYLDLGCEGSPDNCPAIIRTDLGWQPPAARAELEAPDQRVYFFAVLRDNRGGLSFMRATVRGR